MNFLTLAVKWPKILVLAVTPNPPSRPSKIEVAVLHSAGILGLISLLLTKSGFHNLSGTHTPQNWSSNPWGGGGVRRTLRSL